MKKEEILNELKNNGGLTLKEGEPFSPSAGYQVGVKEVAKIGVNVEELETALQAVEISPDECLGFWVDGEDLYIDKSEYVKDRKKAVALGAKHKQKSLYVWHKSDCLWIRRRWKHGKGALAV